MAVTRGLEGLATLLAKQPIIPTYKARDFWSAPASVEAAYERHVRSYIPLARGSAEEGVVDVSAFEARLLRLIKEYKAPLGYIAAEYGHGKTSTGLFLWRRARVENVLAVPPFSFDAMEELLDAVAGWARFSADRVRPGMAARIESVYKHYRQTDIAGLARNTAEETGRPYEQVLDELRRLDQQGRLRLRPTGLDYVNFLEDITKLAKEAGYDGLLVVADELQQYIEHENIASAREPVADLFDLINTMFSRVGRLACGIVFLLPNKELGFLNEQRGDLIQRMKNNRLALDLGQVYGGDFALRLWTRLAEEFAFTVVAPEIITDEALRSLGEIAVRSDLASGPRTVVDVFKIACQRFIDGCQGPYGVLELVSSFERGEVTFDGISKIQSAVRQALAHDLVRGQTDRERAVRLMAAYPTTGLTEDMQILQGVREAVDDVQRLSTGDLVVLRGGGFDHDGRVVKAGVTLKALRPPDQQLSWLKDAIRRFRRDYYLGSERVRNLALDGLRTLVVDKAFGASGWRVESEREATAISFNRGVLVRGCFPSMSRQFPDRLVHCRLLGPGEAVRDTPPEHDLLIDFVMHLPLQASPERQRRDPGRLTWLAPNYARVELNVLHSDPEAEYVDLNPGFQDIVAPYEVNPLLTLSLYASLSRSMSAGQIPGSEESTLRDLFLPALLSAALRDLFGPELGRTATPPVTSAEAKFVESLVVMLCERTYGDAYVTLMVGPQWQLALRQYRSALGRIDHPLIRRGQERYLSTKTQLAELLGRSNAALDNFIQMFPQLITVDEPFRGNNQGAVRFTLHPLEHSIYRLIESGERKLRLNPRSRAAETVPILPVNQVFKSLMPLGYRQTEIDAALELLEARQMIQRDLDHGLLIGWEPDVPTVDEVRDSLQAVQARLTRLRPLLDSAFASSLERNLRPYLALAPKQPLAPHQLINANRLVERVSVELSAAVASRRESLRSGASQLADLAGDTSSRSDSLLSQAAVGGLFVDHLNAVRVGLLREMNELKGAEERMRRNAREVRDLLGQSTLADDELIMAFGRLEAARRELEQTRRQREVLGGRVSSYREAARLLGEATALLNERLLPLGAAVAQQRDDLDRWARDIREALAIRRTEALQEVEPWRSRFQGIKQQVDAFENAQRDAFAERQQFLRGLLVDLLKVKAETLGPALTYNPVSPAESYRLLEEQVCDLLGGLLQNAGNRLKEIAHSARNLAADETLRLLPEEERSHAAQDMDGVARTAMSLFDSVRVEFAGLINLVAGGKDVALDEIEAQAKKVQQFREPVADLFTRIQSYKAAIRSVPLTLSEERANALLIRLSARGEVDFRDFEEAAARELAAEDAWDLLKGLVRKSRAQVRIQAVRL